MALLERVPALLAAAGIAALSGACVGILGTYEVGGGGSDGGSVDAPTGDDGGSDAPSGKVALAISRPSLDFGTLTTGAESAAAPLEVTNTGTAASAPLVTLLEGAGGPSFVVVQDGCQGKSLAPQAKCAVQVKFRPTAVGPMTATFRASDPGGASATTTLTGTGIAPGALTITPAPFAYGDHAVGSKTPHSFEVANTGGSATGALTLSLTGTDQGQFQIVNDLCSGRPLAATGRCTVDVLFIPGSLGTKTASLLATATPGGTGSAGLSGNGVTDAAVELTPAPYDFGPVDVGAAGPPKQTFTATNRGGLATSALTLQLLGANSDQFPVTGDTCGSKILAPGASCTVDVTFKPTTRGPKTGSLQVTSGTAVTGSALSGAGRDYARLSVTKSGAGTGTVSGGGIDCGATCFADIARTTASDPIVTLTATADPTAYLTGWSIASCGTATTCNVTMSAAQSVNADFGVRPDTTITAAPPAVTNRGEVSVDFTSSLPGATFECQFNNTVPQACTSPWSIVGISSDMTHTLSVTAIVNGVRDLSPATTTVKYVPTHLVRHPLLRYTFDNTLASTGELTGVAGTYSGGTFQAGKFGQGLKLDGAAGSMATLKGTRALFSTTSYKWTIAFWYQEPTSVANTWFFDFRTPGGGGWETYHGGSSSQIVTCWTAGGLTGCGPNTFPTPVTSLAWHHLLFRYDAAARGQGAPIQIYLDGNLATTIANATNAPIISKSAGDIALANRAYGGYGAVIVVDDAQVYDETFTPSEQCVLVIGGTWTGTGPCVLP